MEARESLRLTTTGGRFFLVFFLCFGFPIGSIHVTQNSYMIVYMIYLHLYNICIDMF